jgi:tRNA-specific 2-thiouridylase
VVIGQIEDLNRTGMWVGQLNLQKYSEIPTEGIETVTKVRYKDSGTEAIIQQFSDKIKVDFHDPVSGIAPGQAAVFYEGDDVVGGGWILKSYQQGSVFENYQSFEVKNA